MGGHALKNCVVRRYSREEYFEITKEVFERLALEFEQIYVPRKLGNKDSFGDLDIIYLPKESGAITKERIEKLFPETKEVISKFPMSHFEFREFQIDLQCCCTPEEFVVGRYWFEFEDAGIIMTWMAHESGFRFGYQGLFVPVVAEEEAKTEQILQKMFLCTEPRKIWEFFGLSLERWVEGFANEKECADYLVKSKFFQPFPFTERELSATSHKRQFRERRFMSFFLKYVAERFPNESEYPTEEERLAYRKKTKIEALEYFGKRLEYEEIRETFLKKKATKTVKIDGARLGEALGLSGKSLGQFITAFKSQFVNFEKYLEEKPIETVIEEAKYYKKAVFDKS